MENNINNNMPNEGPQNVGGPTPAKHPMPKIDLVDIFSKMKFSTLLIVLGVISALILVGEIYFGLLAFAVDNIKIRLLVIIFSLIWTVPFIMFFFMKRKDGVAKKEAFNSVHWGWKIPAGLLIVTTVVSICLAIFTTPMFMADQYNQMISVTEKSGAENEATGEFDKYLEFKDEVQDFSKDEMQVAIIDKAFAALLGEKVLGDSTGGYASQFAINNYTLIHYRESLYWVGAIEPKGFFQWTSSSSTGSPGYVLVDATQTGDNAKAELVTSHPLKYTTGAFFHQDAERALYFGSMNSLRDSVLNFELDDEGTPYYTQAIYKKKFGITSGSDVIGVMTLNAETGEVNKYAIDKAPAWIDRIQPSHIITEQLNYWGEYSHGYFNTWFAKKEVNNTTEGYSYVYNNGNLYFTTGISAKASDNALIGMVLTNTRTKETNMYNMTGATEQAAMKSAEGKVQEKGYNATFPALINFNGVPTFYIGLKDSAGNIKMYSFVSVEEYTSKIVVANTPDEAKAEYAKLVGNGTVTPPPVVVEGEEKDIVIANIVSYVSNGNTMFLIVDNAGNQYTASINIENGTKLLLATNGQTIKCIVIDNVITKIISVA